MSIANNGLRRYSVLPVTRRNPARLHVHRETGDAEGGAEQKADESE